MDHPDDDDLHAHYIHVHFSIQNLNDYIRTIQKQNRHGKNHASESSGNVDRK